MADTDTTPLLNGGAARRAPLKWPHYLGGALLVVYVLGALAQALSSGWTFIAGLLFLTLVLFAAKKFHKRHAGRAPLVTPRFLLAQLALGAFVAPLGAALVTVLAILALLVPTAAALFLVVAAFAAKYPDAMAALADEASKLDARAALAPRSVVHAAVAAVPTTLAHVARHAQQHLHDHHQQQHGQHHHGLHYHGFDSGVFGAGAMPQPASVWRRMVDAGAAPVDLAAVLFVLALVCVAFAVCAAVAVNAAREFARWKLFKRYTVLVAGSDEDDEDSNSDATKARALGVRGVVLAATAGAFGMALARALSGLIAVSTASGADAAFAGWLPGYEPGFYAGVIYVANAVIDVLVFVGSMLYVATAFATKTVLDDTDVDMRKAWTTSVVYNLALGAVCVGTPGPGAPVSPPVAVFLLVTLVRVAIALKFTKRARARFVAACAAEDLASAQGQQQVEEA